MSERPIPASLVTDRATIALVTRWRNLLHEHKLCRTRVNWTSNRQASTIEKKRRARRWKVDALLNEIEGTLISFLADATRHHDLYTPLKVTDADPLDPRTSSRLDQLVHRYFDVKKKAGKSHHARNHTNRERTHAKRIIVQRIAQLKWVWLKALYRALFPETADPPRRPLDVRTLRPKRIRSAHRSLT